MARTTFNISMPESMRSFVEDKVDAAGYGSVSEYIRELIRVDQRAELERFDAAIERQRGRVPPSRPVAANAQVNRSIFNLERPIGDSGGR